MIYTLYNFNLNGGLFFFFDDYLNGGLVHIEVSVFIYSVKSCC